MATSVFYSRIRNLNYFRPKRCCFFYPVSCVFLLNMFIFYHFGSWVNAWLISGQPKINGLHYRVENVIKQFVYVSAVRSSIQI